MGPRKWNCSSWSKRDSCQLHFCLIHVDTLMEMIRERSLGLKPSWSRGGHSEGDSTQRGIWAQGQEYLCPLPPLLHRELHLGLSSPLPGVSDLPGCNPGGSSGRAGPGHGSPVVHPEHSNSKAQSSGMSQLNRQMQHHQLPPAHPSPSAPGKHLSTGRELPQVQALQACLELGSRLDSFFQNTQSEKIQDATFPSISYRNHGIT